MEHTPVQVAAPIGWAVFQQTMLSGFQQLHRKALTEFSQAQVTITAEANFTRYPPHLNLCSWMPFISKASGNSPELALFTGQITGLSGTKRTLSGQTMNRFKHGSLTGRIGAQKQIEPRMRLNRHPL